MVHFLELKDSSYVVDLLIWFEKSFFCKKYMQNVDGCFIFIWTVYNNVVNGYAKTSNSLEGWHRSLNERIGEKKPSLLKVFEELQAEQHFNEMKILNSLYNEKNIEVRVSRFKKTCCDFELYFGVEYLFKIAFDLSLDF
jgi:hypothetical protein